MRFFQKQLYYADIIFGILTLIAGFFLHFLYTWTGENYFAGLIAPVNESVWEHLKLLFFPVLFFSIFEYFYVGHYFPSFITARTIGCTAGMLFIIIFYYTYSGIIGTHLLWADILTFFLGVAICYCLTWHLNITQKAGNIHTNLLCILFLLSLISVFFYFTARPPKLSLFISKTAVLIQTPRS